MNGMSSAEKISNAVLNVSMKRTSECRRQIAFLREFQEIIEDVMSPGMFGNINAECKITISRVNGGGLGEDIGKYVIEVNRTVAGLQLPIVQFNLHDAMIDDPIQHVLDDPNRFCEFKRLYAVMRLREFNSDV